MQIKLKPKLEELKKCKVLQEELFFYIKSYKKKDPEQDCLIKNNLKIIQAITIIKVKIHVVIL